MCDVLFITPNSTGSINDESVGTNILASILISNNIKVNILRFYQIGFYDHIDQFVEKCLSKIMLLKPRIVSFYTRCDNYHICLQLAACIKKQYPKTCIVFGGPHSDIVAIETITSFDCVDFVCRGEGETTVLPFFQSLLLGSPDYSIPGLVWKSSEGVMSNHRADILNNLDDIPFIDYADSNIVPDDLIFSDYSFPIDVGRGCPFACSYCSTKTFWGRKFRIKSPERIVSEIDDIHNRFGYTNFTFDHDMFTMNKPAVYQTCELIRKLDYNIKWKCSARFDCIDFSLVDAMVDSGLEKIYFGVESGSNRIQKIIHKNLNLNDIVPLLSYITSKNIGSTLSFIYGFPEENEEDISDTIGLIDSVLRFPNVNVQTHLCTFLPGTELSSTYHDSMRFFDHYSDVSGSLYVDDCKELIHSHPDIFQHFMEYSTELRDRLVHFPLFITMWAELYPVYHYYAENYYNARLIEMYYDFCEYNNEFLSNCSNLSNREIFDYLFSNDGLLCKFFEDANYGIIKDLYRLKADMCFVLNQQKSHRDIYCVSPVALINRLPVSEIVPCATIVNIRMDEEKSLQFDIYSLNS